MGTSNDRTQGGHDPEAPGSQPTADDGDTVRKTFIESTKRQRAHWTSMMLAEKRRTGDASLNLSSWIIRRLPQPEPGASPARNDAQDLSGE